MEEREFNILIGDFVLPTDKELFFGPLKPEDKFFSLHAESIWPDVFAAVGLIGPGGIFPSKGQARKNGFVEIPDGWSERTVGKLHFKFFILKIVCCPALKTLFCPALWHIQGS